MRLQLPLGGDVLEHHKCAKRLPCFVRESRPAQGNVQFFAGHAVELDLDTPPGLPALQHLEKQVTHFLGKRQ